MVFSRNVRKLYAEARSAYLTSAGYFAPERYQSNFIYCGGAAEVQYIFTKFMQGLPPRSRVLIVGVFGGRDYYLCKNLGYEVVGLDLGPQPEIDDVVIHNVEECLPFPPESFDAVIVSEVLEHLVRDAQALSNLRQVLRPDGRLIVSLPFYNDREPTHLRIYSPESGRRLLTQSGFEIDDYLERPGILWARPLNLAIHLVCIVCYKLTGGTIYHWTTSSFSRFEYRVGHMSWPRWFRRHSALYGGYYLCRKSLCAPDYLAENSRRFTQTS